MATVTLQETTISPEQMHEEEADMYHVSFHLVLRSPPHFSFRLPCLAYPLLPLYHLHIPCITYASLAPSVSPYCMFQGLIVTRLKCLYLHSLALADLLVFKPLRDSLVSQA
jgi:hypothetical protein